MTHPCEECGSTDNEMADPWTCEDCAQSMDEYLEHGGDADLVARYGMQAVLGVMP